MQATRLTLLVAAGLVAVLGAEAVTVSPEVAARAARAAERAAVVAETAEERAAADAEANADPGTGGSNSFFDTFMAFLGSSALHQQQPEPTDETEAAGSELRAQHQSLDQGRSLHDANQAPVQDGGQADRVKRTGAIPAQLLHSAINHKLGYLGAKSAHHIHFHNYNTKCDKPHFSLWEFKKAILRKLLEAAKAIGGGVLALKGKLLTAKGHLVAAKGRKLATKGEELTEFGKGVLAKALGHGVQEEVHAEVHTAPSAAAAPYAAAAYTAVGAPAAPAFGGYHYSAPQYLPPASGHGYNQAVSLLNEYSRAGFGPAAHAAHAAQHRAGMAPTGPSATGPAGTLPGQLQAGLLVLQPAPSAPQRSAMAADASFHHAAVLPAPSQPAMMAVAPASPSQTLALFTSQGSSGQSQVPSQPLVLAPEYMDSMSTAEMSNKVRRYAAALPSSRRSLDDAMADVVRGLQGSDLLLQPHLVRSAASRLSGLGAS